MPIRYPVVSLRVSPGLGVLIVGLGTVVVPFDSSVNVAFPHIIRAFDLPIPAIQWVVIAYTLTYAALTLVFGRIGDMLGYRRIFLIGSAWSMVAFVLCGAAPSYPWLLAARVMQGVGAALSLSCGPALATSLYPEQDRARVLGLYTMVFGIGGAIGPVIAGQLVLVLEAMKMEHHLHAPCDGVIDQVLVSENMQVAQRQLLIRLV